MLDHRFPLYVQYDVTLCWLVSCRFAVKVDLVESQKVKK
jgi:hypothetical protein